MLASQPDPLLLVEVLGPSAELVAQMTDHRGRLVADLATGEGLSNHWHRLQLLADTDPVEGRGNRHPAGLTEPGSGRDVTADAVVARLLRLPSLDRELALERIDHTAQVFGVNTAFVAGLKLAHSRLQFGEWSDLAEHTKSIPNKRSESIR